MAVVGKQGLVDGQGDDVGAQIIEVAVHQAVGQIVDAQGGLHFFEAQLVVVQGVPVIKGHGKAGVEANAEGHLLQVVVLHRQGVAQGVSLQGEGGYQPEGIGKPLLGLGVALQGQDQLLGSLAHQDGLHLPGEAVLLCRKIPAFGMDRAVHHLAAVGKQHRRVAAPDGRVRLPDVLHTVAFAHQAYNLCAKAGNRQLEIFVFKGIFHGFSSYCSRELTLQMRNTAAPPPRE